MNQATAPAKIILFGEHAVVHGQPAIAVPVTSMRVAVEAQAGTSPGIKIIATDVHTTTEIDLSPPSEDDGTLVQTVKLVLQKLKVTSLPSVTLTLTSSIPMGRGFGSGAAVSAALAKALCAALDYDIPSAELNDLVYEVEKAHHGNPSGLDNTVIVYQKPVFFIRGQPLETFEIKKPFTLLIGDTGYSTPTYQTVGDVGKLYKSEPDRIGKVFDEIGEIARQARQHIETGTVESLGSLMVRNHDLLQKLTVSSIQLDFLCEAALEAGALGAKLSGGGRGGNMIALVADERRQSVVDALYAAGAENVTVTRVGNRT